MERLYGAASASKHTKDAFHRRVVDGDEHAVDHNGTGTKLAAWYILEVPPGESRSVRARLTLESQIKGPTFDGFDELMAQRIEECEGITSPRATPMNEQERVVVRQADGEPGVDAQVLSLHRRALARGRSTAARAAREPQAQPQPQLGSAVGARRDLDARRLGVSRGSRRGTSRSTASRSRASIRFAKQQLLLLCREVVHAPERPAAGLRVRAFGDVNPPVHAWAPCVRVYRSRRRERPRPRSRCSSSARSTSCWSNFTWWVNRRRDSHRREPVHRRLPRARQRGRVRIAATADAGRQAAWGRPTPPRGWPFY